MCVQGHSPVSLLVFNASTLLMFQPFIFCNCCIFDFFHFSCHWKVQVLSIKKFNEYKHYIRIIIVLTLHLSSSRGFDEPTINPPGNKWCCDSFSFVGQSSKHQFILCGKRVKWRVKRSVYGNVHRAWWRKPGWTKKVGDHFRDTHYLWLGF